MSPLSVEAPDLSALPRARLQEMRAAGARVSECEQMLADTHSNVVSDIVKDLAEFYQWDHYPKGDMFDWHSHSQYFYHAHDASRRHDLYGDEHGHFHTFVRAAGFPEGVARNDNDETNALTHLVAVSIDLSAKPQRLFTTNQWVTSETWHPAPQIKQILPRFQIAPGPPSWPVNDWITNLLVLFRPTIERLVDARDTIVADLQAKNVTDDAHAFRDLEITSVADISVRAQIAAVDAALGG